MLTQRVRMGGKATQRAHSTAEMGKSTEEKTKEQTALVRLVPVMLW